MVRIPRKTPQDYAAMRKHASQRRRPPSRGWRGSSYREQEHGPRYERGPVSGTGAARYGLWPWATPLSAVRLLPAWWAVLRSALLMGRVSSRASCSIRRSRSVEVDSTMADRNDGHRQWERLRATPNNRDGLF